jgi:hypothetical protein
MLPAAVLKPVGAVAIMIAFHTPVQTLLTTYRAIASPISWIASS